MLGVWRYLGNVDDVSRPRFFFVSIVKHRNYLFTLNNIIMEKTIVCIQAIQAILELLITVGGFLLAGYLK